MDLEKIVQLLLSIALVIYVFVLAVILTLYVFKVSYKLDKLKTHKTELEIKKLEQQVNDHELKKQFMQKEIELMEKRTK